jgi:two-component system OmpR family sensor kinase
MRSFAFRLGAGYTLAGFAVVGLVVLCFAVLAFMRASEELSAQTRDAARHAAPFAALLDARGVRRGAPAFVAAVRNASPTVDVVVSDMRTDEVFVRGAWRERSLRDPMQRRAPMPFLALFRVHPERLVTAGAMVMFVPTAEALAPRLRSIAGASLLLLVAGGLLCLLLARALANAALRPLLAVTAELERFGAGELRPGSVGGTAPFDEFARLAKAYDAATRRVSAAFERREESEREMRRFVGDAAHELRTPLTIVGGCIDALTNEDDARERRRTVDTLAGEHRRLRTIVDRLLLLVRLETPERTGADAGAVDVVQCAEERVAAFARAWPDRNIACDVAPGVDGAAVLCDEDELRIALDNLIENALKYAPHSPIDVAVRPARDAIALVVRDRGPGLRPADRAHVFERFYRGSETRGEVQGSGLGLAIVQRIAERHGGSVSLQSPPGGGCIAELRFPAAAWAAVL